MLYVGYLIESSQPFQKIQIKTITYMRELKVRIIKELSSRSQTSRQQNLKSEPKVSLHGEHQHFLRRSNHFHQNRLCLKAPLDASSRVNIILHDSDVTALLTGPA